MERPENSLQQLLLRISTEDRAAFSELFNMYSEKIYGVACSIIRNEDLAEDIVQDVFMKLWERREQLPSITNFDGYIYQAARNHTFNMLQKIAREAKARESAAISIHAEEGRYSSSGEEELQRNEKELELAINNLLPQQRRAFNLCQVGGMTYEQAAEEMKISPFTVKGHVVNARKALRKLLGAISLTIVALFF